MTSSWGGTVGLALALVASGCSSDAPSRSRDAEVIAEDGGADPGQLDAAGGDEPDAASGDEPDAASGDEPDAAGSVADVASVLVQRGADSYRIDVVEVSQQRYAAFLGCSSFEACGEHLHAPCVHGDFDADAMPDQPVLCVSARSADVFCKRLGKRLCTVKQLDPACDSTFAGLTTDGNEIERLDVCAISTLVDEDGDGAGDGAPATLPVGTASECRGLIAPFDQVFDVIGNAEEIASGCGDGVEACSLGGSYSTGPHGSPCDARPIGFDSKEAFNGFRCCDSAAPLD